MWNGIKMMSRSRFSNGSPATAGIFLSWTSRKLNSLNPFCSTIFWSVWVLFWPKAEQIFNILCLVLVLENIFRKPQLVDESSRILAGKVKVQFRYEHLSSIIFRPFDWFKITTLRRFVNVLREASSDQMKRVDQVLLFQNISTEMAGKTF